MATFTVRNVPDPVHDVITRIARRHNRSAEAEVRAILAARAAKEMGAGFGQSLRECWSDAFGDELSDLRDKSPASPAVFE